MSRGGGGGFGLIWVLGCLPTAVPRFCCTFGPSECWCWFCPNSWNSSPSQEKPQNPTSHVGGVLPTTTARSVQDGLFGSPYGLYTGSSAFESETCHRTERVECDCFCFLLSVVFGDGNRAGARPDDIRNDWRSEAPLSPR